MKKLLLLPFAALMVMITACSSIDCMINGRVLCHFALLDSAGNDTAMALPVSVIMLRPVAGSDTTWINQESSMSSFDLPMSYNADVDEIEFQVIQADSTTVSDTISITKTNEPYFESVDCAPRYHHTITAVSSTNNVISSIVINNPNVSNDASVTNIQIYIGNTAGE